MSVSPLAATKSTARIKSPLTVDNGILRNSCGVAALLFGLMLSSTALGQAPDPGGVAARQDEATRSLVERALTPDQVDRIERGRPLSEDAARAPVEDVDGPTFEVGSIVTNDSEKLSAEAIRAAVAPFENRTLSLADIQRLVNAIDDAYVAAGYKAGFAVVPDQDLAGGVLNVLLVEPRVDTATISGVERVSPDFIASRAPVAEGELLDLEGLENRLNLINRTSLGALSVEALLQPGGVFGTTSVEIAGREAPPIELITVVENYGTEETGRMRGLSIARINNLLGRDDVLQLGVSGSENSKSGFASYSLPVWGFVRLNTSASIGNSRIGSGTFGPLNLGTDSNVVSASLRAPLFNSERWLISGEAGGELSFSTTKAGPLRIERRIDEVFAQIDATYYGDTSGLFASVRPSWFRTNIKDNAGRSRENYSRVSGALFGFKRWGDFDLRARGAWQWTRDDLLPTSKQFSLGGPNSVRGYQTDQFTGDKGFYLGLEARYRFARIPQSWGGTGSVSLLAFADGGAALPFRAASRSLKPQDYATSVGGGVEASLLDDKFTIFAGVAQPLDRVHRAIHQDRPRFLFSAALRVPFLPRDPNFRR